MDNLTPPTPEELAADPTLHANPKPGNPSARQKVTVMQVVLVGGSLDGTRGAVPIDLSPPKYIKATRSAGGNNVDWTNAFMYIMNPVMWLGREQNKTAYYEYSECGVASRYSDNTIQYIKIVYKSLPFWNRPKTAYEISVS